VKIKHLQLVTQKHSVTVTKTLTAYSPFGPVRAGLTTSQITNEVRLTELLNSLESVVASLVSKSYTVLDTLTTATKEMLAEPLPSTIDEAGIDARI
jgi:glutathionyl-hydroquinone reductase